MSRHHLIPPGLQPAVKSLFAAAGMLLLLAACQLNPDLLSVQPVSPEQVITPTPVLSTPLPTYAHNRSNESTPSPLASSPSAAPTTQPEPTKSQATPTIVPLFSSDLLYLSDEKLMRWDYVTNYSVVLVDKVIDYSLRPDGKQIALLRTRKITANGKEIRDLDLFDLDSKQITRLVNQTSRLSSLAISPDGNWLAYVDLDEGQKIYAISIESPNQRIALGVCQLEEDQTYTDLFWSPDSTSILWSDSQGLWITGRERPSPRLIHNNRISITDPQGDQTEIKINISPIAWSPHGRFILTNIVTQSGFHWHAIMDSKQNRLVDVPASSDQNTKVLAVEWLENGKLLELTGSMTNDQITSPVLGHIWQIMPTREDLMVLERVFPVSTPSANIDDTNANPISGKIDKTGFPEPTNHDYSGIVIGEESFQPDLFIFDWADLTLRKLTELSIKVNKLVWSPDKNGVLIIGANGDILFLPFENSLPIDISSDLGADPTHFEWTIPSSRFSGSN